MKKIFIFLLLILIINCSNNDSKIYYKKYKKFSSFNKIEKWDFKKLGDATFILPPQIKIVNDKYLVILNDASEQIIQVYDLEDGALIESFGRIGQGPGEFIGAFDVFNLKNRMSVYDINLKRLTHYNIDDTNSNNIFNLDTITKISNDAGSPSNFNYINQDTIVSVGTLVSRLCFYDVNGDTLKTNKYIPGKKEKLVSNFIHLTTAYQCKIEYIRKTKKIWVCNYLTDQIEIYNNHGKIIKTIQGPDCFFPEYTMTSKNRAKINNLRFGYTDLCGSDKYTYCIYSGEHSLSRSDWLKRLGKDIFIFDSSGIPIKKIKTKLRLGQIEISQKLKCIYVVCYDGNEFYIAFHRLLDQDI